jgi:hypothetical protein
MGRVVTEAESVRNFGSPRLRGVNPQPTPDMHEIDSLRICPKCDCRLCFESGAEPITHESWLVVIQCPNCWYSWRRTVGDVELELFENALDDDTHVIESALDELAAENIIAAAIQLAADVENFAAALEADAILPMDF